MNSRTFEVNVSELCSVGGFDPVRDDVFGTLKN
jgi:hypothetical protein